MKVTLAKAMKEKNRVLGKIQELENKIRNFNLFENPDEETGKILKMENTKVDILSIYIERGKLVDVLTSLKTVISKANSEKGITELIYKKEELKSFLCFLRTIPVNVRTKSYPLGEEKIAYVKTEAQISQQDVEISVKNIQKEIENIQDKIDDFNASTYVEIPDFEL